MVVRTRMLYVRVDGVESHRDVANEHFAWARRRRVPKVKLHTSSLGAHKKGFVLLRHD